VVDSLRCIISGSAVPAERSLSTLGRQLCNLALEIPSVCSGTVLRIGIIGADELSDEDRISITSFAENWSRTGDVTDRT
jgi:hypothetical protein